MLISLSLIFYFFCLIMFSLIRHPVYYCILLILKALTCSFLRYTIYGFSWYSLIFCLVYIGGVYILFVFVSVHTPNSNPVYYWKFRYLALVSGFFFLILSGYLVYRFSLNSDFSGFLKTSTEGYFYICMCLTLLFGFFVLRIIMRIKLNYYR